MNLTIPILLGTIREKRGEEGSKLFSHVIIDLVVTATGLVVAVHAIKALAVIEDIVEVHASNVVV